MRWRIVGVFEPPLSIEGRYAVTKTNVFQLSQPGSFIDPLTEVLRDGARALLAQAIEAEVATLLSRYADESTDDGHQRLVRHGHLPEREIMTGIGPVAGRCPRVRDRVGKGSERIRFSSAILPPYARRSKSLEVLIPILYLKGISTGDFEEALVALLGKDAGGLSASTIGRLKEAWSEEHMRWSKRDLSAKRYVYFWVDGIHVQARLEHDAQCLLVIIGATPEGKKELVGLTPGYARAHDRARNCSSTSSGVDYRWDLSSRLPMARSASGKPWKRFGHRHAASAAGCTRPPTSSTSCRRASNRRPSGHCRRSGWPKARRMRWWRLMPSSKRGASNTRGRSSA